MDAIPTQRKQLTYLPERPLINISFQDLSYSVPSNHGSKIILRGINGEFLSGQLTAIMGPSGAGKSTLLNILAGYRMIGVQGMVYTNGEPRNIPQFRKLSRYIMQKDLLQPMLTVKEAMDMVAALKLGTQLSKEKKDVCVEEILQLLRLDKSKNTATERLSGGEMKRLSIALELLNNPPVIFLDEPTTGLDDVASTTCVSLLKMVARGGRTVVCSIHTPSARLFAEFDHVYVVADGKCAYQGTSTGVVPYLRELNLPCPKTYNPADFLIEVTSGDYGPHLDKMVAATENGRNQGWRKFGIKDISLPEINIDSDKKLIEEHDYKYNSSQYRQFLILLRRMLLQYSRNKSYIWLQISLQLALSFLIGSLYLRMGYDASKTIFNFGFCYACIIVMFYIPMMPVLLAFPTEVQLLKREYFNRWYGLKPYFAALIVSKTPPTIILALLYITITYPLSAQPIEFHRICMFSVILVLVALISEALGIVVASSLDVISAVFVGSSLGVPLMLLSVYGIGYGDIQLPLVWKLGRSCSFMRYGLEGIIAAIYSPPRPDLICPDNIDYCEYKSIPYFLKLMGLHEISFVQDLVMLILTLLGMYLAGYYLLRQRLSPNYAFRAIKLVGRFVKSKISH